MIILINMMEEPLQEYVWVKAGGNTHVTIGSGKIFTLNQPTNLK